jgi:hypothetical protein
MTTFTCHDCGQTKPVQTSGGTGYGHYEENGPPVCYACCGERDKAEMQSSDRFTLYWDGSKVTNWPGSLVIVPDHVRHGSHNIAGSRVDVWFTGPDGARWHGVQFGEMTQILHCRKLKAKAKVARS